MAIENGHNTFINNLEKGVNLPVHENERLSDIRALCGLPKTEVKAFPQKGGTWTDARVN